MDNQQRAHVAHNLSYVLHDRSDSDTVRQYVRAREAERKRCSTAIRDLARRANEELRERLIVIDEVRNPGKPAKGDQIISLNIGAIDLLPRLLHVAGFWPSSIEAIAGLLDGPRTSDQRSLTFFGAPAALNTPALPAQTEVRWLFATAVLRPGYSSILLRVTRLDSDETTGDPNWRNAARLAEDVIREFPLQWWCVRPLWERPVEETLPEFLTR